MQRRQLLAGSGAEKMMWTFVEVVESCRSPKALEFCPWEHQLLWPMRREPLVSLIWSDDQFDCGFARKNIHNYPQMFHHDTSNAVHLSTFLRTGV